MQGRKAQMGEISEILRCFRLTGNVKETARTLGKARGTVRRYVRWAGQMGYLADEMPSEAELAKGFKDYKRGGVVQESLAAHQEKVLGWLEQGVTVIRMHELLREGYGWLGSYESLKRYTLPWRMNKKACVRLEVEPGKEAQVDFGYAGLMWDPVEKRARRAWLFLMTLSHSRHAYGEFVFRQDVETWIGCHRRAFEWFGGVPEKIVLDNLKAAITKAAIYDPIVNRTYRECAVHYGFIISPCRPATPEHKGKVEKGIPFVRRRFLAGSSFAEVNEANVKLLEWLLGPAGLRIHGTTKQQPLVVFETVEKAALLPLPVFPYHMSVWKEATLHRDCHVTVLGSYYSAPHHLRGRRLLVKLTDTMAYVYHEHELVASHLKASRQGTWRTILAHYPPEKAAFLEKTPQWCLKTAKNIGEHAFQLIHELLLASHPFDNLRKAQGILGLAHKYPATRMEAAARRALHFGALSYQAYKNILEKGLDQCALDNAAVAAPCQNKLAYTYVRPLSDFTRESAAIQPDGGAPRGDAGEKGGVSRVGVD